MFEKRMAHNNSQIDSLHTKFNVIDKEINTNNDKQQTLFDNFEDEKGNGKLNKQEQNQVEITQKYWKQYKKRLSN